MSRRSNTPSQRQLRVGEQIRHIVAESLQRGHFADDRLLDGAHVTVTEVRVSPDLKSATAYVISMGGTDMDEIIPALNEHSAVIQQEINQKTNLKFTPRLKFTIDKSFEQAGRIEEILRNIPTPQDDDDDR